MSIVLHGFTAGKGIAIGRAHLVSHGISEVPQYTIEEQDLTNEVLRFETSIKATRKQLEKLRSIIPENAPTELGAFISLHLMLLTDATLSRGPIDIIKEQKINSEWALKLQKDKLSQQFDEIDDAYLRERKQDMLQVVERIHNNLIGQSNEINYETGLFDEAIIIAKDLSPAAAVFLKEQPVAGFVTDIGGPTSHTAILGRSLDIPSVIGLHNARELITENEWVIIDGVNGVLIVNPDELVLTDYRIKAREFKNQKRALNKIKKTSADTSDGTNIELLANIESIEDIKQVHSFTADGVGLFRSEFLYLNRDSMPSEDEQYDVYTSFVKKLKGKSITIRTVDLGVDKNPRWFGQNTTPNGGLNPALGLTGTRLCLAEPIMFRTQMRAILRAAVHGPIKMMWPMISSVTELKQCFTHLEIAKKQLIDRDIPFKEITIGCMIEIPSAALTINSILKLVDFVSVGTNDLIQYVLSVDRADDSVSYLYQPDHPSIIKLLLHISKTACRMGKTASICGEMAGDTTYTRLLLGLGYRRFSMNSSNILSVKDIILRSNISTIETAMNRIIRNEDPEKSEFLIKNLNNITDTA